MLHLSMECRRVTKCNAVLHDVTKGLHTVSAAANVKTWSAAPDDGVASVSAHQLATP